MRHDRPRPFTPRNSVDPELRDLLLSLRDTFRDAAARIDRYLGAEESPRFDRGPRRGAAPVATDPGTRMPLESLREEARQISQDAAQADPAELRLRIQAVAAETRALQNRATDPEDRDIAAKILRALTAIVSEYRPGHVYGLARHHQADWDEVGRRAREELAAGPSEPTEEAE